MENYLSPEDEGTRDQGRAMMGMEGGVPRDRYLVEPKLRKRLGERARELRGAATRSEGMLWAALRGGRLGARFRRQEVIGQFIVDFCCWEHALVIEVDGPVHQEHAERDAERQRHLEAAGFRVLRFSAHEVEHALSAVIAAIRRQLQS